jgi:hypothetical protein
MGETVPNCQQPTLFVGRTSLTSSQNIEHSLYTSVVQELEGANSVSSSSRHCLRLTRTASEGVAPDGLQTGFEEVSPPAFEVSPIGHRLRSANRLRASQLQPPRCLAAGNVSVVTPPSSRGRLTQYHPVFALSSKAIYDHHGCAWYSRFIVAFCLIERHSGEEANQREEFPGAKRWMSHEPMRATGISGST